MNYKLICFQPFGSDYRLLPSPDLESDQPVVQWPNWRPCLHPVSTTPTTSTYDQPTVNDQYQINDQPAYHWSSFQLRPVHNPVNKFVHVFLLHCCPAFVSSLSWLFTLIHVYKSSRVDILIGPATDLPFSIRAGLQCFGKCHTMLWL